MEEDLTTSANPRELSHREAMLESRIKANEFDTESWEDLLSLDLGEVQSRVNFERCLTLFPMAHLMWLRYMEFEERHNRLAELNNLFKRTLKTCYSVDLWVFYLKHTLKQHSHEDFDTKRTLLTECFEEAISESGLALDALPLYQLYLQFLESMPDKEMSQKVFALRKLYQRAVIIPLQGVDTLYRKYREFEEEVGGDRESMHKEYTHASIVVKERDVHWRALHFSVHLLPRRLTENQLALWEKMIQYELTNPEMLNRVMFIAHMRMCFSRASSTCWFHAEMWFRFAEFEQSLGGEQELTTIRVLKQSLLALPASTVLGLTLADTLESLGLVEDARLVHQELVKKSKSPLLFVHYMRFCARQYSIREVRDVFRQARASLEDESEDADSSLLDHAAIYVAMAELEYKFRPYRNNNNNTGTPQHFSVAKQVFELGLKRFPKHEALAMKFIHFLSNTVNEYDACKELFERLVDVFDKEEDAVVFRIWDQYRQFELQANKDVAVLANVEKRIALRFPHRPQVQSLNAVLYRYFPTSSTHGEDDKPQQQQPRAGGSGSHITTKQQQQQHGVDDGESLPPFLRKLASLLPKKIGLVVDTDAVFRQLGQVSLPPPPLGARGGATVASLSDTGMSRKRNYDNLGVDHAPVDVFKQRRERM